MNINNLNKLFLFCNNFKNIYIWGKGNRQRKLFQILSERGVVPKGFMVSEERFRDGDEKNVYVYQEEMQIDAGFIIATSDQFYNEILQILAKGGCPASQIYFMTQDEKREVSNTKETNASTRQAGKYKSIDNYRDYCEYIENKCKKGQYNLLCHRHLGDTLIMIGLKEAFEKKYKKPLHYLIPQNQAEAAGLYCLNNFTPVIFSDFFDTGGMIGYDNTHLDMLKENLCEKMFTSIPRLDIPFILTPTFLTREQLPYGNFVDGWARMLGLSVDRIKVPVVPYQMSKELRMTIEKIAPLEKVVLFAPEAKSYHSMSKEKWECLADYVKSKGYTVITNSVDERNSIAGTIYLKMCLSDLFALGSSCRAIFSFRSGLCDCLVGKGDGLFVFYTKEIDMEYHLLNKCFDVECKVNEIDITDMSMEEIIEWTGERL